MGWSFTAEAGKVAERIEKACRETTGSQNVAVISGRKYLLETVNDEQQDGGILIIVFEMDSLRKIGPVLISGSQDGAKPVLSGKESACDIVRKLIC